MKLPKRVRRQTSFFENSDDESSLSPSPPARPAPGRTKQVATPQKKGSGNKGVAKPKGTTPVAKPTPKKSHKKKVPESPPKVVPPSPSQEVVDDTPKKGATPPPTASTPSFTAASTTKLDPKKSSPPPPPSVSVDVEPAVSSLHQTTEPSSLPAHRPKPPTSVVVGVLPHVTWFSLQFLNVGVPFALSTNHCGVRFNDGSCILAAIPPQHASITKGDVRATTIGDEADAASPAGSGKKRPREGAADLPTTTAVGGTSTTVIYINRHCHRFSVRPATTTSSSSSDSFAKLIVPSPLERKFMALMWCKDALANSHKRAQFGFLQGVPAMMRVADDMVDLSSVMGGSAKVTDFPLPLYLSGVQVGTSTDGSGSDSVTFELSNRSDVYPNRCYYPSDDDDGD